MTDKAQSSHPHLSLPRALQTHPQIGSWLRINPDNTVTIFTGKVELGQGLRTALAQIVAEELELPLSSIVMESVSTSHSPDEGYTAGSASLEQSGVALRLVAAQLRERLKRTAANAFGQGIETIRLKEAKVWREDQLLCTYADLARKLDPTETISGKVPPKQSSDYHLIGNPLPRLDLPRKVSGQSTFIHDLQLPGMVHGRVLRAPLYGARLDTLAIESPELEGVLKLERQGNFVGVIAEREHQAIKALEWLTQNATWQAVELPNFTDLPQYLRTLPVRHKVVREDNPTPTLASAAIQLEVSYFQPYQAHASVAPSCALALAEGKHLTVWTHSQGIYPLRRELAFFLNMDEADLTLIHKEGAGCYGHNGADDVAADAALLALALPGRPVRVQWSLQQELQNEPYSPAMLIDIQAGLNAQGKITGWNYEVLTDSHVGRPGGQGDRLRASWEVSRTSKARWSGPTEGGYRNAETLYTLGNARIIANFYQGPLRVSALRTLGAFANTFANESFMDELAYAAQCDPLAFRLRHLENKRARAVLKAAAEKVGWQAHSRPSGRGVGIAFARYKNSKAYVAQVVQLRLDAATAEIDVERIVTVCDAGQIINPDGLTNQLEGGTLQGLSRSLYEEVTFEWDGSGMQDWEAYKVLGFGDIPEIETMLIDQPHLAPLGAGEAATPPVAAAIANALYDASGIRLRELPFTPKRLRRRLETMTDAELGQVILEA